MVSTEAAVRGFTDFDLEASVRVMVGMALSLALHDGWLHVGGEVGTDRMIAAMTTMAVRGLGVPEPVGDPYGAPAVAPGVADPVRRRGPAAPPA